MALGLHPVLHIKYAEIHIYWYWNMLVELQYSRNNHGTDIRTKNANWSNVSMGSPVFQSIYYMYFLII